MNLMLLAAGLGSRLLPYTNHFPKPTIPFLNVPMGLYQFQYLKYLESKLTSFVVNTHHLPEHVQALYISQPYFPKRPQFSSEAEKILGNGGAIKKAEYLFTKEQPILLMNADEVYFSKNKNFLNELYTHHKKTNALATLTVMQHPEAGSKFGAVWCDGKAVKHIGKTCTDKNLKPWHYIGVCILSWEVMKYILPDKEQNILYDVLFPFLDRLEIFELKTTWFETGNKEDLLAATEVMLKQLDQNAELQSFINQYDRSKLILSSLVSEKQSVSANQLHGYNCISKNAHISSDTIFENSIVFENQIIK